MSENGLNLPPRRMISVIIVPPELFPGFSLLRHLSMIDNLHFHISHAMENYLQGPKLTAALYFSPTQRIQVHQTPLTCVYSGRQYQMWTENPHGPHPSPSFHLPCASQWWTATSMGPVPFPPPLTSPSDTSRAPSPSAPLHPSSPTPAADCEECHDSSTNPPSSPGSS